MIQYFPFLEKEGISCQLSPLFDDEYLSHRFLRGNASLAKAFRAFFARSKAVLDARSADVVIIHCDLYPYLPGFFEALLRRRKIPYIYDYDDAIFHYYDMHKSALVRRFMGNKIRNTIRGANAVLAGSPYLLEYARSVNPNVEWSPTCVDISRFAIKTWKDAPSGPFTIGWIGAPTSVQFVGEAIPAIREFSRRFPTRVVFVGSGPLSFEGVEVEVREWTERTEVAEMLNFDVGIMPLPDEPWTRGKCAFKLIQYMACGLPVIASPVGMNNDVVTSGSNGFLALSTDQWLSAFESLANSVSLRRKMGIAGRQKVQREYTTAAGGVKLLRAIQSATCTQVEPARVH
jgi:glycosyltransferase involved in cell wall biosynthesis